MAPVLREYIISEAMYALGIPTTRALAVVRTGESVFREVSLPGAILTRVAASHIRVGTFQFAAMLGDLKTLSALVDYVIERHYPKIKNSTNPALALLGSVIEKQTQLITNWMRVGFVHGVMNTDNMAISGETIDYGPCAFMDVYDLETVFSSIDGRGRYAYGNQPSVAHWNLSRFAETLLPLIHKNQNKAIELAGEVVGSFDAIYKKHWFKMMRKKIGLLDEKKEDEILITSLLAWMQKNKADYTNTFCSLGANNILDSALLRNDDFHNWYIMWQKRLKQNKKISQQSTNLMRSVNPLIIPRNHRVEEALSAVIINNDLEPVLSLLKFLKNPYDHSSGIEVCQVPPGSDWRSYKTFCGT